MLVERPNILRGYVPVTAEFVMAFAMLTTASTYAKKKKKKKTADLPLVEEEEW